MTENPPVAQPSPWKKRGLIAAGAVIVLVGGFFFCTEFLPRWWSHRVAEMAHHGTFRWGIWWGLFWGVVSTAAPLLIARLAFHKPWVWKTRIWVLVVAVVVAAPNLMTAGIVWGGSSGAHAGDRVMDDGAPGFRGATLVGVIIGVAVAILVEISWHVRRKNNAELTRLRVDQKLRDADDS